MKHKTRTRAKRWLAVILCLCMIFPSAVTLVSAAEEPAYTGGPCEHHTEHTAECGYVEAVEGQLCTHVHDGNCGYQEPTEEIPCAHVHDDSCGYQAATEEIPCDKECIDEDGDGNIDHQEGCAYQPAMAEQPCTHTHDENCGYQAATEGSPCAHVHNEDCGYVEAVEGKPCTFVCEICSGNEAEPQDDGEVTYTINVPLAQNGISGVEYNLMAGVSVSPDKDTDGNPIQVRISSVTSSEEDFSWDGATTITPQSGGVRYTITYEAYITVEEEETVLATKTTTLTIMAAGDIGEKLNGDYAYISEAGLLEDKTTESKLAIRTGSAPWDEDDAAGNDSTDLNNTVRSFDIISYTAYFKSKVRNNAPYAAYETGTLHFEFILPGTAEQAQFETGSMGWLSAKKEVQYEITESTYNGQPCQVLRGSYLWEPSDENPSAIGESYQELTLVVRALALKNGDTLKPEFTFWLDHNDVPEEGLVTGSGHSCSEHREIEYKTITAPDVSVTSAPRFNVQLKGGLDSLSYVDTFDFGTGNDSAANKDIGTKEGRVSGYGITLQIQGETPQHGLRGCELPDGSDITLELDLSSIYRTDAGEEKELFDDYPLLLWSIEGQSKNSTQADGRVINGIYNYVPGLAPVNEGVSYDCCYNGGTWKATQTDGTISITVSGYEVNTDYFPHANSGSAENDVSYYNPDEISHYWEIQNACFSAGEVWLVQSFYDEQGKYVVEKEGSGTFSTTVQDVSLNVTGKSGTALPEVTDNSNQVTTEDDRSVVTVFLSRSGTISANIAYLKYGKSSTYDLTSLTENCIRNGKDWVLGEGKLAISGSFSHTNAEGVSTGVAYDTLIKFDDTFFQPDGTYQLYDPYYSTGKVTVLFGAKKDKAGWNHRGKSPHEAGYDAEMMETTADELLFFSSLDELKNAGYTCVAALAECRGIYSTQRTSHSLIVNGTVNPEAKSGSVYMCTVASKGWNKSDVQEAAAKYLDKGASTLTDEDYNAYVKSDAFPSRAGKTTSLSYEKDYPSSFWTYDYENVEGLRTYKKAIYDENGFVDATGGLLYGDSCLVVGYATEIRKSTAQQSSGQTWPKNAYDMDVGQRIADYVLYPSAVRSAGESSTGGELVTTVYVEDTLPKGLTYIPNSSYWGGTYTQTEEGKQGVVEDGQQIKPEITVHSDGTTTLRWTLEKVTITSKEVTEIAPIYYSCDIGKPGDEENDVQNNDQLLNTAIIWSDDEQRRDFKDYNNNLADFSILISKNNAVSLSKLADQAVVDQGDTMGFTLNVGNNATNFMAVIAVDSLPYVGDTAGSAFTGDCVVTEYAITALQGEFASNFKLYYTIAESERGKGSEDYTKEDFTKEGSVWTELAVNSTDGTVTLPEGEFKPVAIAAVGTLPAQQTLKMHVTMDLPDAKPGEYVANRLTRGDLESFGRSYIVSRTLEGVVWLDDNKNGLRAADETRIDGVQATLMQLTEGGESTDPADYTPYQISDGSGGYKSATVATGYQLDLSTGEQITLGAGRYKFTNLPQGTFGVLFSDGTVVLGDYKASPKDQGTDDTLDSDAEPVMQDGVLKQAFIPNIVMPPREQITTMVYASRYHDLGLYASQINIPVEKVWDDNNNQDGKRPNSVTVTLYADGRPTDQSLTLNESNSWKGTFENLDEFKDGEKIKYTVKEAPVSGYTANITDSASGGFTITNSHMPETITISGSKTWNDSNNQDGKRPESITIRIYANGTELTDQALTVTADDGWKWSFTGLPKYEDGSEIKYTITEDTVPGYTSNVDGFNVTNSYTPGKTNVAVTKSWNDAGNQDGLRPGEITVKLLADGQETNKTLTLSSDNNWQGTFSGLDKYREGKEISYSVAEVSVTGYETEISGSSSTGFTITNTHTPETVNISGSKTWNDNNNQDGKRPSSITIRLYANGTELKDKALTVTADNGWTWNFDNLPKYANGKEITYTISEDVVEGYTPAYDGLNVTNTYTPEQTSVTVTKAWDDAGNQDGLRPGEITVKLLADGQETKETLTLSSGNNWTGTFNNLDKYRDGGEEIVYTIEEVEVSGYDTVINGDASTCFTVTNSHTPATTEVSGSKTWDDADDQDGKRPKSITIRLYANGDLKDTATVTAEDGWEWRFTNLPKYANGEEILYTITEDAVPGYTTKVEGFNITNSYTPGKTSVTVTKAWNDAGDQDGLRPAEITVKLLADGKDTGKTLKLSEETRWTGTFSDLDEYKDGEKIVYSVKEVSVKGYDSSVTGNATTGFVITNSHTPAKIDLSGSKTWDDADNQDGKRPTSITIRLYANGDPVKTETVTAEDGWKWSFTDLPKYESGSEIRYTITEDAVPGYQSEVDGMDVTNHYTPGQINIPVTKNWQDKNDADGIRPDSITVKLYADGEDTGKELVLDQKNNWTGSFDELDEYADGVKIVYTIAEVEVKGYDTAISGSAETGFVISNSHTPDTPDNPDDPDQPQNPGQPETPDTPKDDIPQTGDTTNLALWVALLAISGTGLTATLIIGKKKRYRGKHMK